MFEVPSDSVGQIPSAKGAIGFEPRFAITCPHSPCDTERGEELGDLSRTFSLLSQGLSQSDVLFQKIGNPPAVQKLFQGFSDIPDQDRIALFRSDRHRQGTG